MKAKIAGLVFIIILIFTIKYCVDHKSPLITPTQTTNPQPTPTSTTPTPEKTKVEVPLLPTPGWTFTHCGSGYDWFVPDLVVGEPTAWFVMTDLNTTYRVKRTCVVELKAKADGSTTSFLVDTSSDTRHVRLSNGEFSPDPWPEAEFQKAAMAAQAIRFKSFKGGALEVKMGRTE